MRTGKGLYLAHFVPFARAVTADSPHVYFISRGGCLVSLPSDVINAQRAGPVVLSLMNSAVAALLPTSVMTAHRRMPGIRVGSLEEVPIE